MSITRLHIVHKYVYFQHFYLQQLDREPNAANFEENQGTTSPFDVYFESTMRNQQKDLGSMKTMIRTQRNQQEAGL